MQMLGPGVHTDNCAVALTWELLAIPTPRFANLYNGY